MSTRKIEHKAPKKQTMTLDELAAFVQDAMRAGADGGEVPHAELTLGGKIKQLAVDVPVKTAGAEDVRA